MSNEQMAQSILQFTGGKGNIRIVSNCMTRRSTRSKHSKAFSASMWTHRCRSL